MTDGMMNLWVQKIIAMTTRCKLTMMNVEDIKRDEEIYGILSTTETKPVEESQVIRELNDSIRDLIGMLEGMEGNGDARPKTQEEF